MVILIFCSVFVPPPDEPFELAELEAEVWVLRGREGNGIAPVQVRDSWIDSFGIYFWAKIRNNS